jgi:hypothetical protein
MAEVGRASGSQQKRRLQWRPWLRSLHRDAGYLAVGLTIVYALSGLAVNHITDWDPSFRQFSRSHRITAPLPADAEAAAKAVLAELKLEEKPREVYASETSKLEIVLERSTLHVARDTRTVLEEGQQPRPFLRLANWLHLNRGKKAWTYIADGYAVLLLYLAISGLFMIPGRKGLLGRGALLAALGAAIPVAYVVLSGGPEAKSGTAPDRPSTAP